MLLFISSMVATYLTRPKVISSTLHALQFNVDMRPKHSKLFLLFGELFRNASVCFMVQEVARAIAEAGDTFHLVVERRGKVGALTVIR